jgi:hypothetical protein
VPKEKFIISNLGNFITIELPEESFTLEDIQFAKKGIAKEIGTYLPDVTTVQFIESHILKPAVKPEEKKVEEKKAEAEQITEAPAEAIKEPTGESTSEKTTPTIK